MKPRERMDALARLAAISPTPPARERREQTSHARAAPGLALQARSSFALTLYLNFEWTGVERSPPSIPPCHVPRARAAARYAGGSTEGRERLLGW
jgi:hypothetical protein